MRIRCESCKKYYNYDESEVCPECGAFNTTDRQSGSLTQQAYQKEKKTEERNRQVHMAQEHQRQSRQNSQQDSCRWDEPDKSEKSEKMKTIGKKLLSKPKVLAVIIVVAFFVLNMLGTVLTMVLGVVSAFLNYQDTPSNNTYPVSEAELEEWNLDDIDVSSFSLGSAKVPTEVRSWDDTINIGNMEIDFGEIITLTGEELGLSSTMFYKLAGNNNFEKGNVWLIPYTTVITEEYLDTVPAYVSCVLEFESSEGVQNVWEEWDEDLLSQLEKIGYRVSYVNELIFEEAGAEQQAYLAFLVTKDAEPVRLKLEYNKLINWEEDYENSEIKIIQRIHVEHP